MLAFEATKDFETALNEIDLLIDASASNSHKQEAQDAFNKAAILLLSAKLESFFEQIIEEFCYQISNLALTCENIPNIVRIHASKRLLNSDFLNVLERCQEDKITPIMEALARLWHSGCTPTNIAVDSSFNFGKHGEKEIKRLFKRIGIEDIFEVCKIKDDVETLDDNNQDANYSITSDVNALTGYRNFIIHNDGTPSITHSQINLYRKRLHAFAEKVDEYLTQMQTSLTGG